MPSPVKVVFNADTGQFVSDVDGATQSVLKQAEAVASAKNRILAAFKEQTDAAKANGASAEDLARIQVKAAESLANVSEKNAGRVISALDRISDKQKRVAAELKVLGDMPTSHGDDITNKQRASALLRGGGIRAGESFLTQFDAFNKLSTVVFPVLGITTLADEGIRAAEAIYKIYENAKKLPDALKDGFEAITSPMELGVDNLRKVNDELEITNAHLAHKSAGKPDAALQIDLIRIAADELAGSSRKAFDNVKKLLEENKLGFWGSMLSGQQADPDLDKKITDGFKQISELDRIHKEAVRSGSSTDQEKEKYTQDRSKYIDTFRASLNSEEKLRTGLIPAADGNLTPYSLIHGSQDGALNKIRGSLGILDDSQDDESEQKRHESDVAANKKLQDQEKAQEAAKAAAQKRAEAARKAAEEQRSQWDEEHDSLVNAGKMSAGDDFDFWTGKVYSVQVGSANYKAALDKQTAALAALRKSDLEAAERADAAAQKAQSESWDKMHGEWAAASHRTAEDEKIFWALRTLEAVEGGENYRKALERENAAAVAAQKEAEEAAKARSKASLEKGQQQTSMAEAILGIQVVTGQISRQDAALQQANIHAEQYRQKMAALNTELARQQALDPDSAGTVNAQAAVDQADADRQVQIMQDAARTAATSWQDALKNANALWVQDSQDSAKQVVALYTSAIDGMNQQIVSFLTAKHGHGIHTTDWKGLGRNLAKEGTGDLLKQTESSVMKGLRLAKADGSRGNPYHVLVDNPSGIGGGASGISSLFGSKSDSNDDSDSPASGFASIAGTLIGSIFGGHRALGGGVKAGVTYDVGEMGREEFTPDQDGYITPTNRLGNGAAQYTVNVGNGVTPEQMKMHVREALAQFHPQVVASSVAAMRSERARNPSMKN